MCLPDSCLFHHQIQSNIYVSLRFACFTLYYFSSVFVFAFAAGVMGVVPENRILIGDYMA